MIPDRDGREVAFEPLLDELLPIFCPGWELPQIMEGEHQHHRCEVKRFRVGQAALDDPEATRQHMRRLIRAAVHDQCRSGVNQLVKPLIKSLGHRPVQEALISHMEAGTLAEKVGATMAWYWARPGLQYGSREDLRLGVPTKESKAFLDALNDLRDRFRTACLAAFLDCEDVEASQDLSLRLHADPSAYPVDLQHNHEQAMRIILANPERYRWFLERSPTPPATERR